jgi:hypothetical protein
LQAAQSLLVINAKTAKALSLEVPLSHRYHGPPGESLGEITRGETESFSLDW